MAPAYAERIALLLSELGIPPEYARVRSLSLQEEAEVLVVADTDPGGADVRLIPEAAAAWGALSRAAKADRLALIAFSGFRSVERQAGLIRKKQAIGMAMPDILRFIAAPGYSEHHTGRAIDVGVPEQSPLTERFEETDAYRWLTAHAGRFGFRLSYPRNNPHGFGYEPWHWCFQAP